MKALFFKQRLIDFSPLITRTFSFREYQSAFELAQQKDSLKVLLRFDERRNVFHKLKNTR